MAEKESFFTNDSEPSSSNNCTQKSRDPSKSQTTIPADQVAFDDSKVSPPDRLDDILENSENAYKDIVKRIVNVTDGHLDNLSNSKQDLKKSFTPFFKWFLVAQYVVLTVILILNACVTGFHISDVIIATYITSVFVETLSVIVIMIKYAFNSDQEVELLRILSNAISNYQKFTK